MVSISFLLFFLFCCPVQQVFFSLMFVHTKTQLKCGVLGISHIYGRKNLLLSKNSWRLSHFPAAVDSSNPSLLSKL